MADNEREDKRREDRNRLPERIGRQEERKLLARSRKSGEVWFGIGTFGMIGWAVTIPALLLTFLGIWLDARYPTRYSWTLTLLVAGIALGCLNAWYWVSREHGDILRERQGPGTDQDQGQKQGPRHDSRRDSGQGRGRQ